MCEDGYNLSVTLEGKKNRFITSPCTNFKILQRCSLELKPKMSAIEQEESEDVEQFSNREAHLRLTSRFIRFWKSDSLVITLSLPLA
jgi:hypothetical protein